MWEGRIEPNTATACWGKVGFRFTAKVAVFGLGLRLGLGLVLDSGLGLGLVHRMITSIEVHLLLPFSVLGGSRCGRVECAYINRGVHIYFFRSVKPKVRVRVRIGVNVRVTGKNRVQIIYSNCIMIREYHNIVITRSKCTLIKEGPK